jgi:hypothetical protein
VFEQFLAHACLGNYDETPDSPTKVVKEWKIGVIFAHDSLSRTL